MHHLQIITVPIADLKPRPTDPRTHSKKQLRQVANSIARFGWTNPVIRDETNTIIPVTAGSKPPS